MDKLIQKYKTLPVQVRASMWFLICSFLQKGISMITTPIFTRLLTTQEYGKFNVFNSWLSIVTVFVTLNLYNGVFTRGLVKYEEDKERYASVLQSMCTFCIFVGLAIYGILRNFWNHIFEMTTTQVLLMFIMIWATAVFNFWSVSQRVDFKYRALVIITLISSVAKPVLGIILVRLAADKVTARILGLVLVEVVVYTGLFVAQMKRGKSLFVKKYWVHALHFNLPLIPHYLSQTVLNSSDRIMIQKMTGADEAGIYSLAYSISQIMTIFNTALLKTIEPWLYKKMKANRTHDIGRVAYLSLILVAAVNLILIALAPEAVAIFAPAQYHEAIWVIPPVAMGVYFMFAYTFFAVVEFYFEKTKYVTYATMSGAVLNIILNYICIKLFGYMAAGYTTLVCYVLYTVAHYCFAQKICNDKMNGVRIYNLKTLLTITGIFMISGFLLMLTYNARIIRYGLLIAACIFAVLNKNKIVALLKNLIAMKKV